MDEANSLRRGVAVIAAITLLVLAAAIVAVWERPYAADHGLERMVDWGGEEKRRYFTCAISTIERHPYYLQLGDNFELIPPDTRDPTAWFTIRGSDRTATGRYAEWSIQTGGFRMSSVPLDC